MINKWKSNTNNNKQKNIIINKQKSITKNSIQKKLSTIIKKQMAL